MKRFLAVVLMLALSACARGSSVHVLAKGDLDPELYETRRRVQDEPRHVRVLLYFTRTDKKGVVRRPISLGTVSRELDTSLPDADVAIQLLLDGPTPREMSAGLRSAIPSQTELLGVSVTRGVANLNLTAGFETASSELGYQLRISEVVWTLTELPDVDSVRFRIHGVDQPVIDQSGVPRATVGRGRYSNFAPDSAAAPGSTTVAP